MTNLYETLGVPKNATPDEIKSAWRSAAREHHPDREGGSHEAMQAVNQAYEVLGDPARRQTYDETGSTKPMSSIEDQARTALAGLINEMVDAISQKSDLAFEDPIGAMRDHMHATKRENADTIGKLKKRMEQREKAIARLKRKSGENFLVDALRGGIAGLSQEVAAADQKQKLVHAILDELAEYEYAPDARPRPEARPRDEALHREFNRIFGQAFPGA